MIKTFCDRCGDELTSANRCAPRNTAGFQLSHSGRLGLRSSRSSDTHDNTMMVEVITGKGDTWNTGDWCKYCVISAVNELDDRPRAA